MLYDQDGTSENRLAEASAAAAARRQRAFERQRERELEWRREAEFEREREARRRRARQAQRAASPPEGPWRAPAAIPSVPPPPAAPPPPAPPARVAPAARAARAPTAGEPAVGTPAAPTPAAPTPPAGPPATASPARTAGRAPSAAPAAPSTPPARAAPAAARAPVRRRRPAASRRGTPSTERATAILAAGTFASRATGFLRVLTIGYVLGVTSLSDAFNYANGIPNIIYDLLIGGLLAATLIPVFVDLQRGDDEQANMRGISAVLSAITVALVLISALLWLLAPWVIHFYLLLNPRATGTAERALATQLLHYFAPQVFFLGAIVVSTAMLNARRHFAAAAFSPVVNNVIAIAAILATKFVAEGILTNKSESPAATLERFGRDQHAIWVLGIGTTLGYVVQFLVQLPAMRRAGYRVRLVWDLHHPAVRRVARLSSWLIGVVIANQVSLALVMVLAGKTQGGVTAYQFSYQFFQLPYALIAVSIATALMPDLAERWSAGDRRGFERQFVIGLRVTLALLVPVGLAYVAIAQPFIQLAVHHGRVSQSGAHLVSSSLALFAVGLPGFSAFFLLMRLYQAMQSARAMFWIYAFENALTVVAALVLEPAFGVPGLALAWVGPYTIASLVAVYDLRRRVGSMGGTYTVRAVARILIAGAAAGGAVAGIGLIFPSSGGDAELIGRLIVQLVVGTAVYLGMARVLGITELRRVGQMGRRLVTGSSPA
jgi:putative peptidoglycan lipid II flippase